MISALPDPEDNLTDDQLVVECSVSQNPGTPIRTQAMIDTGATGYAFMDSVFAQDHDFVLTPLRTPRDLTVVDGTPISSGQITHIVRLELVINGHREYAPFFVTRLGHYPIIMGIPWMKHHDLLLRPRQNQIRFASPSCLSQCSISGQPVVAQGIRSRTLPPPTPIHVSAIGAHPFHRLTRKQGNTLLCASLRTIDNALATPNPHLTNVPTELHKFGNMFLESSAAVLPPHRPHDLAINLQEGKEPPFRPMYNMSRNELQALRDYITENLSKGFIRYSESPAGAPILFVKKSDGSLRLCVDYRGLNEITVKNRHPLPLLPETLTQIAKAKYYTKLDLRWGYHQLRIKEGDEWKTAFRTRQGHFEYQVMPFGLTNAPAAFQHWVNDLLRPHLDDFCTAYLDDILIYSDDMDQHQEHVQKVMGILSQNGVHLKPEKCEFYVQETKYLGMVISPDGVSMDQKKVATVQDWETPQNVKDVQCFLGFASFYRRFIYGYSKVVSPLTALTRKNIKFQWTPSADHAFNKLKEAFVSAPILRHFDPDRKIIVETDASDYVSAAVLSQHDDDGILHPVAFFSGKHSPAECNYEIYDKELLAIIRAFEEWRYYLEGAKFPVTVISDHRNLEYFMTKKDLNRRQARWSEFLSRFDYVIQFRPGKQGGKPDALTRRSGDLPKEGDERLKHQSQIVLKQENLEDKNKLSLLAGSFINEPAEKTVSLPDLFSQAYQMDSFPGEVLLMLHTKVKHSREISLAECSESPEGLLLYRNAVYVPNSDKLKLRLLQEHHDSPSAGHPGRAKTLELLTRTYYWPTMRKYVDQYVQNCHLCRQSKATRSSPQGVLRPLPIPTEPWTDLSMDFVTGLPDSNGANAILVVVDRLTKMRHLIPCTEEINAPALADLFVEYVWKIHGLPETIVSDRGTQFTSDFWKSLCSRLEIAPRYSTAFHPQTDGQTERMNAIMEQYLRAYVSYQQDDWARFLPLAEFAANNHVSETTKLSPFQANFGKHPRMTFAPLVHGTTTAEDRANSFARDMSQVFDLLQAEMKRSQVIQEESANKHRTPSPRYIVGDKVWLSTKNLQTQRPSKKLDWKQIGPYEVRRVVSPYAYELALPTSMKVHPVFHVSLLSPATGNPVPGQVQTLPPPCGNRRRGRVGS